MPKSLLRYFETHQRLVEVIVVSLFFGLYLWWGLSVYKDYGISTDEGASFVRGQLNYLRFTGQISEKIFLKSCDGSLCFYPPAFEMVLFGLAHKGTGQIIYQTRHLITYLYFALAVFFFFLIGRRIFKNWLLGLLGTLLLILSPRIFAHSFYNPKDIPFLSTYVIAMFTMLVYLKKKDLLSAILFGLMTGLACNMRTPGVVLIGIAFLFLAADLIVSKASWKEILKTAASFAVFGVVTGSVIIATFPTLYSNPIKNYITTFNMMKQFPWENYQLYFGQNISNAIPWHYSIVWFGISTPLLYVILFLVGLVFLAIHSLRFNHSVTESFHDMYVAAACGLLPVIIVIALKSVLYNDNRQMYFCYPALLLIAVYGFAALLKSIPSFLKNRAWQQFIVMGILLMGLAEPVIFMLNNHPYEYAYFNLLAGPKMSVVKQNFGLDTWHLAYFQALKYISATDPQPKVKVASLVGTDSTTGKLVLFGKDDKRVKIMTQSEQKKFIFTDDDPDYLLDSYVLFPFTKLDPTQWQTAYSIRVGDTDILTVYKRIRN